MYFGKVRAAGGNIRGFKGVAGGVIRWMKLVNDTAVAVDQLGMRQGSCSSISGCLAQRFARIPATPHQ